MHTRWGLNTAANLGKADKGIVNEAAQVGVVFKERKAKLGEKPLVKW